MGPDVLGGGVAGNSGSRKSMVFSDVIIRIDPYENYYITVIYPYPDFGLHAATDFFATADLIANIPIFWGAKPFTMASSYSTAFARDFYDKDLSRGIKDATFLGVDIATGGLLKGADALSNVAGRVMLKRAGAIKNTGLSILNSTLDIGK